MIRPEKCNCEQALELIELLKKAVDWIIPSSHTTILSTAERLELTHFLREVQQACYGDDNETVPE
jgi:hypothetical protein